MDVLLVGGKQLEPIWAVLAVVLKSESVTWRGTLRSCDVDSLKYRTTHDSFDLLLAKLSSATVSSVQFRQDDPSRVLCAIYAPRFSGSPLAEWTGIVEAPHEPLRPIFEYAKHRAGLEFVSWTIDEQPDLETEHVTVSSFPWQDWRLVRAAVRGQDGLWEERSGDAARTRTPHRG